ncbi:hypothetical protein DRW41_10355 [Neobacillus piezotolerans]|uniref:Dynamin N-terminal domain-containing protein n=1 Tax=Neobacillus piezotolerans TaxID=2259171 RepID=A0A3D8GRL8_9BACI|nr:dynamin family protein [Neobacillus piezotolerans]RDU37078.1 hypothetical protein DRW41_10355 [Neobacillus piezotolerans]
MNYVKEKELLQQKAAALKTRASDLMPESSQLSALGELLEDLERDYYTLMVVGEFKHGKSTFVNALLGQDIMPRDVTPTTATINAVFHSETPGLEILKMDGTVETKELSVDALNQYTASADFNPDEIKYLKLFLNAPLLENRVVLIDTPGVNDLNQQRSDITFQFLPRADVIIFLTSLDSAFKQTEKTFIQEFLMKNGLENIIFAANFMDRVDEEELDETIEFAESRVQSILGGEKTAVFPLSAKDALDGKLNGDEAALRYSGFPELEKEIVRRIESGSRSLEKLERFQWRLKAIAELVKSEIRTAEELSSHSLEDLESQLEGVAKWFANQDTWRGQIKSYLSDRRSEINYMVAKSIQHFGTNVKEDIENRIRLFHGADIKNLVEAQIPIAVKSHFNTWANQYSDYIHELLHKTQAEVTKGLIAAFNENVTIHAVKSNDLQLHEPIPILNAKSGNAAVKAGVVLGGVSTVAVLLGGPFFLPIVGMAGLPYLSQKLAEKQLENIKPELIIAANSQIGQLITNFEDKIVDYVHTTINKIQEESLEEFTRLLRSYETMIKREISSKQREAATIQVYRTKLAELERLIESEYLEGVSA